LLRVRDPYDDERAAGAFLIGDELHDASRRVPLGQARHRLGVERTPEESLVPALRLVEILDGHSS
jgi:hypothetical protein